MRGISLIMPVFHAGKRSEEIVHFREALDSVVALSLSADMIPFELIIVDDASKNPYTQKTILEYAEAYPWIKTISNDTNAGPSYARNRALDIAQYDHIAGVDADDILTNHTARFYKDAVSRLSSDPFIAYINPKIRQFGAFNCLGMIPQRVKEKEVALIGYAPACSVLRAEDVKDVGGWREDALKAEDWKLAVDVLAMRWRRGLSNNVITLPNISYLYRQHEHGENVNARVLDRVSVRDFLIDGNEDFYKDRFGTASPENIANMVSTKLKRLKHGGALRAVFESFAHNPIETTRFILARSQKLKQFFNAVGVTNPFVPHVSNESPSRRLGLG